MKIVFPNCNGQGTNETLEINNNVVIIGANGAGKSRMGGFIQKLNPNAYRISAQRLLSITDKIAMESKGQAQQKLYSGIKGSNIELPQDFLKDTLSLLFADQNIIALEYFEKSKINPQKELTPKTKIDFLLEIWDNILPHKKIKLIDHSIRVMAPNHSASAMSDGEKVCLYLIGQCLSLPPHSIIVVDEPEIHIHKALVAKLWTQIEEKLPDCQFLYITHDLDFATSRVNAKKIWVREYNGGDKWFWEEVPEKEEIPEELMLKILGSRKPILFVEGEKGKSLDLPIYEAVYPEFTIIPRSNCSKVIEGTKAMQDNETLHTNKVYGLIDRDYRPENELQELHNQGIFHIDLGEVENLLCIPEVIQIVAEHLGYNNVPNIIEQCKNKTFELLNQDKEEQIYKRTAYIIRNSLKKLKDKGNNLSNLKTDFQTLIANINLEQEYQINETLYNQILAERDFTQLLRFYTNKGLSAKFNPIIADYKSTVIRLLRTNKKEQIVEIWKRYLPVINITNATT
jgi:energy-coupling factor transporter ATP-binding protein EcfA2